MRPHERRAPSTRGKRQPVTAQQRSLDESARGDIFERGLSTDVDELGTHFLIEATEQENLETREAAANDGLSITEGSPSDEALGDATFDPTRDIWEQTVALAASAEDTGGVGLAGTVSDDDLLGDEDSDELDGEPTAVVLTRDVVREASLFDTVDEQGDDAVAPRVDTDDVGHHAQRRRSQ
jgi:hypothetical protein